MKICPDAGESAARIALDCAAKRRREAQEAVVRAFSAHIHDGAPAPSDAALEAFARQVAEEQRMKRRYEDCLRTLLPPTPNG
jgi:hypothetical protein